MPAERVVFISSDSQTFSVDCDSGYCCANGLGTAQVWAQDYSYSGVQSAKLNIAVLTELPPEPCVPDAYPSAPLKLAAPIEILNNPPYLEHQGATYAATVCNPTAAPITFWPPKVYAFDLNGCKAAESSGSSVAQTLQPNESLRWISGAQLPSAGQYYLMALICLDGYQPTNQWYIVDQTAGGVANKLYFRSVSQSDLRPDLREIGFVAGGAIFAGEPIQLIATLLNGGDADAADPFTVRAQMRGLDGQDCELAGLVRGYPIYCRFDFPPLLAGNYIADLVIDSGNVVLEYDKSNNVGLLTFTVQEHPLPPVIIAEPQSLTVTEGGQASFCVSAIRPDPPDDPADEPLCYQWKKDGSDISGAIDNAYTVSNVDSSHAGSYACVIATARNETTLSNSATLTVLVPWSDLIISELAPTSPEFIGSEPVRVAGTVFNQGDGPSVSSQLALSFPPGTVIKIVEIPCLAAGEYYNFSAFIDASLPDGTSQITALADSGGIVAESNEENNTASCTINIMAQPMPLIHIPFGCRRAEP